MNENENDQTDVARREFIKGSAAGAVAAVVGLSALSIGLRETLGQAQRTGKPLLTDEALNNLFAKGADERSKMSAAGEAKRDVKGFIKNRFTLTPSQERQVDSLSQEQLETIRGLLGLTERPGTNLTVRFDRPISTDGQAARGNCPITINLSFPIKL
jgi:hypothetical protein